jgi:deoxyribonuclease-4
MTAVEACRAAVPHLFGAHLSIAGGMHRALERARALGCRSLQVFVKNQRQWRTSALRKDDLRRWYELLEGFGPVVAHAGYLINIASPQGRLWRRSIDALGQELRRCAVLRIPYLILHPGSATGSRPGHALKRAAAALNEVLDMAGELPVAILLESTAGQGSALGSAFAELGALIAELEQPQRAGVCLDTCHLFAAGYDFRHKAGYRAMLQAADEAFGLWRVRCWHLNDSRGELGCRRDRHEHIGRGRIGVGGFRNILLDARFAEVPMILETPKGTGPGGVDWDRINLRRLRRIAGACRRGQEL